MFNESLFNITPFSGFSTEPPTPITASVTASDTAYNMSVEYIYGGSLDPETKEFKLYKNSLDGTYLLLDPDGPRSWSSGSVSNAEGVLESEPTITVTYSASFAFPGIQITFDIVNNVFATAGVLRLYKEDVLVSEEAFINNSPTMVHILPDPVVADKAEIVFTKMNEATVPVNICHITLAEPSSFALVGTIYGELDAVIRQLIQGDTSGIIWAADDAQLTVYAPTPDTGVIYGESSTVIENIHTAMNRHQRQIFGKVTITYTDAFTDNSLSMEVNTGTAHGTALTELTDEIEASGQLWFSLHQNKLDGSYKLLPDLNDRRYSPGWWGRVFSDADGVLSEPTTITVTFSPRTLTALSIYGLDVFDNYPVDFDINIYSDEELVGAYQVVGNNQLNWFTRLDPKIPNVTSYTLTIYKISQPNTTPKLSELFTAIRETYYNDEIESISLLEEVGYSTGALPIGNVSANEIDITLSNADRRFDLTNTESVLYGYVKRNRKVRAWLGIKVAGEIEWAPIGTFWTTQWDIPQDEMYAALVARDRLELLRLTDLAPTPVLTGWTLYDLFEYVLVDAGIGAGGYRIDEDLKDIIIPYAWFDRVTHREALGRLASCAIIQVYCDKRDVINVHWSLNAETIPVTTFDDDVNVFRSSYPLAVAEQVNHVEVSYKHFSPGATSEVYKGHQGVTLEPNVPMTIRVTFSKTPVTSITNVTLGTSLDVTAVVTNLYAWGADITLTNNTTSALVGIDMTITGTALEAGGENIAVAQDEQLIREDGKISERVSHDFIQEGEYAQALADQLLGIFKDSRYDVTLENRGDAALELGDHVIVNSGGAPLHYVVTRQTLQWDGSLSATTEGKRL